MVDGLEFFPNIFETGTFIPIPPNDVLLESIPFLLAGTSDLLIKNWEWLR
jgi:hypothetical protein